MRIRLNDDHSAMSRGLSLAILFLAYNAYFLGIKVVAVVKIEDSIITVRYLVDDRVEEIDKCSPYPEAGKDVNPLQLLKLGDEIDHDAVVYSSTKAHVEVTQLGTMLRDQIETFRSDESARIEAEVD